MVIYQQQFILDHARQLIVAVLVMVLGYWFAPSKALRAMFGVAMAVFLVVGTIVLVEALARLTQR